MLYLITDKGNSRQVSEKTQPQPQEPSNTQRLESSASVPQRLSDTQQQGGERRRAQPTGSMPNLASSPLSSSSSSDITSERSGWVSSHRSSPSSSPPPGNIFQFYFSGKVFEIENLNILVM